MPRCRSGKLSGYGDLRARRRARWRHPGDESADDIAPMRDGDDARPVSGMTQMAEKARSGRVRPSRPLSAVADAKRTYRCGNRCR